MVETSCLARRIRIGGRRAYLEPPTIRQVAEILHVLKQPGSTENLELLFELLGGLQWRGASDILIHIRNLLSSDQEGFQSFIRSILMQGYQPDTEESGSTVSSEIDWLKMIAMYCRVFPGRDPWQVYNQTPFTFFMAALPEARREDARQKFNAAVTASFAMGGSKEALDSWLEQGWPEARQQTEVSREIDRQELQENRKKFKEALWK